MENGTGRSLTGRKRSNKTGMSIAIVTGASSGMGAEFVRQLANAGKYSQIWAIARRQERLDALQSAYPTVRPVALDLLDPAAPDALGALLEKERPDVGLLVCCAGFGKYGTYRDLTCREISDMIDLNDKATVLVTYAALRHMAHGARVILLGSCSAFQPLPEFNLYAATKAFVVHFGRALNVELKDRDICVTTVCPGYVNTEFFAVAQQTKNPDTCKNFSPMYESRDVVKRALRDAARGKDMSVLGANVKLQRLAAKVLPKRLIMRVWMKIK